MIKVGRFAHVFVSCLLLGMILYASSTPLTASLLTTAGVLVVLVGPNVATSRNRAKRGKVDDFTFDPADLTTLRGSDLGLFLGSLAVGVVLFGAGMASIPGGA